MNLKKAKLARQWARREVANINNIVSLEEQVPMHAVYGVNDKGTIGLRTCFRSAYKTIKNHLKGVAK